MQKIIFILTIILAFQVFSIAQTTREADWWVLVMLKNGSVVEGAVLADRFVEKTSFGRVYEKVEASNFRSMPGTGIRVYYVRETPGFVFLSYEQIDKVMIKYRLTEEKKDEILEKIRFTQVTQAKEVDVKQRQQEQENLKKVGVAVTEQEEQMKLEKEKQEEENKKKLAEIEVKREDVLNRMIPNYRELLEKYPPGDTWNEENYKKLNARLRRATSSSQIKIVNGKRVVQHAGPGHFGGLDTMERDFIKKFEEWRNALAEFKRQELLLKEETFKAAQEQEEESKKKQKQEEKATVSSPGTANPRMTKDTSAADYQPISKSTSKFSPEIIEKAINDILYSKSDAVGIDTKLKAIEKLETFGPKAEKASSSLSGLAMFDKSDAVRKAAVRSLGEIRKPYREVVATLMDILQLSGDIELRRLAINAMLNFQDTDVFAPHISKLTNVLVGLKEDNFVKYRVVRLLEKVADSKLTDDLESVLRYDSDEAVRIAACSALITWGVEKKRFKSDWIRDILIKGILHTDSSVAELAALCLEKLEDPDTFGRLRDMLKEEKGLDENVRTILENILQKTAKDKDAKSKDKDAKSKDTAPHGTKPAAKPSEPKTSEKNPFDIEGQD